MIPATIEIGQAYFLDGEIPVTVIKAINRSRTIFSIEKPNKSIETAAAERLHPEAKSMYDVIKKNN